MLFSIFITYPAINWSDGPEGYKNIDSMLACVSANWMKYDETWVDI